MIPLHDFRLRPVPDSSAALARKAGYRTGTPIDTTCPEAHEPCRDMAALGVAGANHYATANNPPYFVAVPGAVTQLWLRESVARRLLDINLSLRPHGMEVWLFDAWRPQAIQRYFHDVWFPDWLRARHPHLTGAALMEEVERYWSAPSDGEQSPSPHATGGAVDLTLRFVDTGQPLYMGGMFDDLTDNAWTDFFEGRAPVSMSDEEARANRRLLYWVMTEAGFANNPTEWWHYSWGDQMWARLRGEPAARYGACDPQG